VSEKLKLPNASLFYNGKVPEPLTQEEREWLVKQLNRYPNRVNEARTCAIGALTNMAVTEFCRLMHEAKDPLPVSGEKLNICERLRESAKAYRCMLHDGHADDCDTSAALIERLTEALDGLLACCGRRRPDGHYEFSLVPNRDVEAAKDALQAVKEA
jgi:hypothetical protein